MMFEEYNSIVQKYFTKLYEEQDRVIVLQLIKQVLDRNLLPEVHIKMDSDNIFQPTLTLTSIDEFVVPSSLEHEIKQKQRFYELLEVTRKNFYDSLHRTKNREEE